jgi:hypothetical protein
MGVKRSQPPSGPTICRVFQRIAPPLRQNVADLKLNAFTPQYASIEKAHDRLEIRWIWSSVALNDYLEFPYHITQL